MLDTIPRLNSLSGICYDNLGRANDTLSQSVARPGDLQDGPLGNTWLRLRGQGFVPVRIKMFSWQSNLPYTELLQGTHESPGNEEDALDPGLIGEFGWRSLERSSKIIKHRQKLI